jgi:phytoene dehydrogenase-like protein
MLKATMSASGIIGTFLGVRSPGTAYVLLHHYMGRSTARSGRGDSRSGGTGAISNATPRRRAKAGVEIRTEAPVAHIRVSGGRTNGVVLANGDEIDATLVLSSVDPN